MTAIDKFKSA